MKKKMYDLSIPQNSIWLTEQFYNGTNINNINGTAVVFEVLKLDKLKEAINIVIKNNDVFKIRFKKEGAKLKQYLVEDSANEEEIKIVNLETKEDIVNIENHISQNIFNIIDTKLYKFVIFKTKDNFCGFTLNIHHLLADAWTLGLLSRQIVHAYSNIIFNSKEKIQTYSYINYLAKEHNYINSDRFEKDKTYWEKMFSTVPNIVTLPSRSIHANELSCKGNRVSFVIPKKQVLDINTYCRTNNISIFNFFMSVLSIYLYKITDVDDFVIGSPILNRTNYEEKNTAGMFVNIAPIRISVSKYSDFIEFAKNVSVLSIGALRHQKYPYQNILSKLREKNSNLPNLYNILLSYQVTRANNESDLKYETRWNFNGNSVDDLDIQLYDLDENGSLTISYDYKLSKYNEEEIENLNKRLLFIIEQVIYGESNLNISDIKIVTKEEEKELFLFNETNIKYDRKVPIIKYFEKQVEKNPNHIALTLKDEKLTYKELNEKANILSHILRNKYNVRNNSLVGIMFERSSQMIISILAILKAGGAYLPIDPEYPVDRITYMLQTSKANLLLSMSKISNGIDCENIFNLDEIKDLNNENLSNRDLSNVALINDNQSNRDLSNENLSSRDISNKKLSNEDISNKELSREDLSYECLNKEVYIKITQSNKENIDSMSSNYTKNLPNISNPDDLAYVIFTSGSTGRPKGVMITQGNFTSFYNAMLNKIPYLKGHHKYSIISITTVSFDIFAFETLISLTCGLNVYLTDYFEQKYTDRLLSVIENEKIDIIQTTPSVMRFHIENCENIAKFSNLKYIMLAGENLPIDLVKKIKHVMPNVTILNGYGPSETTIFATVNNVTNEDIISIGAPIANNQIYIVDKDFNLLPKYVTGEIYIGGDGVGKGYIYNEELTKASFIANPFGDGVIYKSGDLGYWNDDGMIICLGRIDNQVKLRGLRVEPDEIEKRINEFDKNSNTTSLVVVKGESLTSYLHAYISSDKKINLEELKMYLLKELPNYMVPTTYSFIDAFPKTPNGKIDRKVLFSLNIPEISREIIQPSTKLEKLIYEEVSKICSNTEFGVTDDFFSIGLDSLKIISLSVRLSEKTNKSLTISNFYKLKTIRNVAEFIEQYESENDDIITIKHIKKEKFYPLTSAQERIYYAQKLDETYTTYNVSGGILIHNYVAKKKITEIFNLLIERHIVFRTSFVIENNELMQKINDNVKANIEFLKENKKINEDNIYEIVNTFPKVFNLEKAPLLRIKVIYYKDNETLVLIDTHHIIVDGTSLSILISEFIKLLNSETLDENKYDYIDYTVWEKDFEKTEKFKILKKYWDNKYKNEEISVINLPYDYPISAKCIFEGETLEQEINFNIFRTIDVIGRKYNISPFIIFLSAFYVLLYKHTGQKDIIIGSPFASRDMKETQNLIGMFVNNMILNNHVENNYSFVDFLNKTKAIVVENMLYQPYPYEKISRKYNNSFFDVMFIYQNALSIKNDDVDVILSKTKTSKYNLSVEILPETSTIKFEYNTSLFKRETINQMMYHYINFIDEIARNPERKISEIPLLSLPEQNQIIYGFNSSFLDYPRYITVDGLIEKIAYETPDKIAITFEDTYLTYKELNDKSNMLAHYLRSTVGVKRNDIIGIMIDRSLDLIVAMIGVLKSSACYIPIDPSFPKNRIEYMLDNSNAKLLIVTPQTKGKIGFDKELCISLETISSLSKDSSTLQSINMPDDSSYVIYTSGSTGKPKGVILNHKALLNLTFHLNNYVPFLKHPKETDCMVSVTTSSFDIFIFETLICLQRGVKVAIATRDEQVIPTKLNNLIEKNNVNAIQMTPSRMQLLIDNINDLPNLKKIEYVILAGESLPKSLLRTLKDIGVKKVYNGYGPSETTIFSTFTDVTDYDDITIGKPISNTYTYVLDDNMKPVPIGIVGELYIGGDGVGKGYINNEELTKSRFIPNPFMPNSIMYKTGDLCKFLSNGELYYIGRVDNQIKIRGLRIELDEIKNKILSFPFVKKAQVIKQSVNEREFLSAYYIAEKKINIANLRNYLLEFLPNYMVPTYYTALDEFPYTPNGKIDNNALPVPNTELQEALQKYVAPETDLEIQLAKIFEKILNTRPVGINDNFFELGGDSILAMRLNIELLKICKNIKYADIFNHQTISKLVDLINKLNEDNKKEKNIFGDNIDVNEQYHLLRKWST